MYINLSLQSLNTLEGVAKFIICKKNTMFVSIVAYFFFVFPSLSVLCYAYGKFVKDFSGTTSTGILKFQFLTNVYDDYLYCVVASNSPCASYV